MLSRNRKTFAVSSLVLNLFTSQIGEFFLPHPVLSSILDSVHQRNFMLGIGFCSLQVPLKLGFAVLSLLNLNIYVHLM